MDVNAVKLKLAAGAHFQIKWIAVLTLLSNIQNKHIHALSLFAQLYITVAQSRSVLLAYGWYVSLAHFSTSHL